MQHREEIPMRHFGDRRFDEQGDFFNGVRPFEVIVSHGPVAEAGVAGQSRADGADGLLEDLVDDEVGNGEDVFDVDEDEAEGALGHAEGHAIRGVPPGAGHGEEVGAVEGAFSILGGRGRRANLGVPGKDALQAGWESDSGLPGAQRDMGILAARLRDGVMRVTRVIKAIGEAHLSHSNAILDSGLGFPMFWGAEQLHLDV